ncbi:MAG TPA: hypothetical protein VGO62_12050, partial [Myxococcota bacterium]|jgi:hypothetical protein
MVRAILKAPQGNVVTAHDVSLALGSKLAVKLNVDVGTAMVQVFENGVAVPAEVRFYKPDAAKPAAPAAGESPEQAGPRGDPVLAVPAGQDALLPPGAYALVVVRGGVTKVFSEIKVVAGKTAERTVDFKAQ